MRTFIIISTTAVATIFASPACSQQPSQGGASIPDFSGLLAAGRGFCHGPIPDVRALLA